jgi:cytosine/adenosine deaminase-related metal-dependent hydrolase
VRGLDLALAGALDAAGRWLAPATWSMRGGCTLQLRRWRTGDPAPRDIVLLPGLVNAHTHLDLAGADSIPARGDFTAWLLGVGSVRGTDRDVGALAAEQSAALAARGVTAVGDIEASGGHAHAGRVAAGLVGLSYLEIVGVARESARARLAAALALADRLGGPAAGLGLSPHAPYSVHGEVVPEIARAAGRRGLPLAMHLAETVEETRYLQHGDGPFVEFLEAIGRGRPFTSPPGLRAVAWAEAVGLLSAGCVVVHGNDLDDADIALLARHGSSVVYCHGTHRHFDRPPHRLPELLSAGVNVALGTDSGLSNRGVDLFGELVQLHADRPELSPLSILRCATLGGRVALGRDPGAALFAPGSRAEGVLFAAAPEHADGLDALSVAAWILGGTARPCATIHGDVVITDPASPSGHAAFLDSLPGHG